VQQQLLKYVPKPPDPMLTSIDELPEYCELVEKAYEWQEDDQLTKAGRLAPGAPPAAATLRLIWQRWLKATLLDEFNRVEAIKGQHGKGKRTMTAVEGRRAAINAALQHCPIGFAACLAFPIPDCSKEAGGFPEDAPCQCFIFMRLWTCQSSIGGEERRIRKHCVTLTPRAVPWHPRHQRYQSLR
jgi:hypothetical protein